MAGGVVAFTPYFGFGGGEALGFGWRRGRGEGEVPWYEGDDV